MPPPDSHASWVEQMLRAKLPRLLVLAILLLAHTLGVHQGEAASLLPLVVGVCSNGLWFHRHSGALHVIAACRTQADLDAFEFFFGDRAVCFNLRMTCPAKAWSVCLWMQASAATFLRTSLPRCTNMFMRFWARAPAFQERHPLRCL